MSVWAIATSRVFQAAGNLGFELETPMTVRVLAPLQGRGRAHDPALQVVFADGMFRKGQGLGLHTLSITTC